MIFLTNWLVLSDEQNIAIFSYLTNEQMSNWLGVEVLNQLNFYEFLEVSGRGTETNDGMENGNSGFKQTIYIYIYTMYMCQYPIPIHVSPYGIRPQKHQPVQLEGRVHNKCSLSAQVSYGN